MGASGRCGAHPRLCAAHDLQLTGRASKLAHATWLAITESSDHRFLGTKRRAHSRSSVWAPVMVFYFTPRGHGPGPEDWLLYMVRQCVEGHSRSWGAACWPPGMSPAAPPAALGPASRVPERAGWPPNAAKHRCRPVAAAAASRRLPPPTAHCPPPRRCLSLLPWPAGRGQVRERGEVKSGGRLNWRHACHLTMQCCALLSVPARLGTPLPPSRFCSAAAAAALTLLPLLRLLCLLCCRI